jgi:hypothetical protein
MSAEPTTVSSSLNSNETVKPSSSEVWILPSVGPVPSAEVVGFVSLPVTPSASNANPVRITSPVKIPVSIQVSTNLYLSMS